MITALLGTGMGGDSIFGKPFKNEIHSRLKFQRRGLVAMVRMYLQCIAEIKLGRRSMSRDVHYPLDFQCAEHSASSSF